LENGLRRRLLQTPAPIELRVQTLVLAKQPLEPPGV